jgi:hypothetical protein
MNNAKLVDWVLRIAVAGEFLGHGVFAIQGKAQWIGWIEELLRVDGATAAMIGPVKMEAMRMYVKIAARLPPGPGVNPGGRWSARYAR